MPLVSSGRRRCLFVWRSKRNPASFQPRAFQGAAARLWAYLYRKINAAPRKQHHSRGFGSSGSAASGCVTAAHLFALRKCVFFHKNPFQFRHNTPEQLPLIIKKAPALRPEVTNTNNTACAVFLLLSPSPVDTAIISHASG